MPKILPVPERPSLMMQSTPSDGHREDDSQDTFTGNEWLLSSSAPSDITVPSSSRNVRQKNTSPAVAAAASAAASAASAVAAAVAAATAAAAAAAAAANAGAPEGSE